MQINPTDRYLAILLKALQTNLMPELRSSAAKASAEMMCAVLSDLLKRQHATTALLHELIGDGERLVRELSACLGIAGPPETPLPDGVSLQRLVWRHGELTVTLTDLCEELAETVDDQATVSSLLRRVAEWELAYYERQARLPTPQLERIAPAGVPLDAPTLQAFLNEAQPSDGPVEVTHFEQLTGGFGKQTFLVGLRRSGGDEQHLVIRKTDPTPIMKHGACNLRSEYDLLQVVAQLEFPAPRPQLFCASFKDVDGSFYTMDRIPGRTPGSYLGGVEGQAGERVFLDLAELLARLHRAPLSTFAEYIRQHDDPRILEGTTEDCYRYNLEGWSRYIRQETHLQSPALVWLMDWLQRNIPEDGRKPVLVHGDFNIHNVLVDQGRVTGVLDWECAGFGAPEQDLAYIRPHISRHIDWGRFVDHYQAHGGRPIDEKAMAFGLVYASLRTMLAGNRASGNLQSGANEDVRYAMVELGFMASFIGQALQGAAAADSTTSRT